MEEKLIVSVFQNHRDILIKWARSHESVEVFSNIEIENTVDELLPKVVKQAFKISDTTHLRRYLFVSLKTNLRVQFRMKVKEAMSFPMTDYERIKNFELAKNIINSIRK